MAAVAQKFSLQERPGFDVIIIGAGLSGMYQLHLLREAGLTVRVLETAPDVGGVWYWNRYPGARVDSEVLSYQYAFTKDLLDEWDWSEMFAGQPELERYFQTVADRYDLRKDIDFNTKVTTMTFDEASNDWSLQTDDGRTLTAHLVIACTGILSAPNYPHIPGMDTFAGETLHTALWPNRPVTFEGKKVAVIGTGATAIQAITEIAKTAGHLTVFQRTANWAVPLRNVALTDEDRAEARAHYPEMFERLQHTFSGFAHDWDTVLTTEYTPEGLQERFWQAWNGRGFSKWIALPADIAWNAEANEKWQEFLRARIKERVKDPRTAELLTPNDHLFGTKRVPCESGYFEVYNQNNVDLVSIKENPIVEVTATGIKTEQADYAVDMIVYATGFDAFTGALKRIDIIGRDGRELKKEWQEGPSTYLGVQTVGFPNLFIMGGPHGKGAHGNGPRCAEKVQEWMSDLASYIVENKIARVEADQVAQDTWTAEVQERGMSGLMAQTKSIFFGDNLDAEDRPRKRTFLAYVGALDEYVARLNNLAKEGYPGFVITR